MDASDAGKMPAGSNLLPEGFLQANVSYASLPGGILQANLTYASLPGATRRANLGEIRIKHKWPVFKDLCHLCGRKDNMVI